MAALMIPGGRWSDRVGRKRCFTVGLTVYGVGALLSAISPGLGVLILGSSLLEGFSSALLIPPVYILTTLSLTALTSRARVSDGSPQATLIAKGIMSASSAGAMVGSVVR